MMSSLSRTLYAGVTNDLERRVFEHQEGLPGSFTARYHINRLVYCEHFGDIDQAIARDSSRAAATRAGMTEGCTRLPTTQSKLICGTPH